MLSLVDHFQRKDPIYLPVYDRNDKSIQTQHRALLASRKTELLEEERVKDQNENGQKEETVATFFYAILLHCLILLFQRSEDTPVTTDEVEELIVEKISDIPDEDKLKYTQTGYFAYNWLYLMCETKGQKGLNMLKNYRSPIAET